ncbi:MAG: M48 family peptidase [Desulfobacteraceae bacterium]|nr:MAG: M48 family peptidase [Desulfobacteraceae bacterium]
MKKFLLFGLLGACLFLLHACATVPVTGRSQLKLVPQSQMLAMSFSQYNQFLDKNPVSKNTRDARMVKQVGTKIQTAVEDYFRMNNMSHTLSNYQWEFNLVENEEPNAWAMPGGKVVINSGILPLTRDETGLAVVIGHEIAHAVAGHGNERMSQGILAQFGQVALAELVRDKPKETQALFMTAFGIGSNLAVILPYSRLHEREADRLGLIFMAMAGYDPDQAVDFWSRMAQQGKGKKPPAFLSTHPSDAARIQGIRSYLPEARQYYKR